MAAVELHLRAEGDAAAVSGGLVSFGVMPTSQIHPYGLGLETGANRLVDYNPLWPRAFAEEAARIRSAVGPLALGIEHFGSTAVPGLRAKPMLDLLIGVAEIDDGLRMIEPMAGLGYDYAGAQGIPEHHIFGLGLARTHLAHVVTYEGDQWRRCLRFRDRLRGDRELRAAYQALKSRLAGEDISRGDYTAGKTAFVIANSR
jgi:GrpB-like predicted nucleotidyltransferase (UPF0157 family)